MKITNFSFTLRQAATKDGYGDNYYVNIDESGVTNISHPYKSIPYKEQGAIFGVIQKAINEYTKLVELCDVNNRTLKLEQYAPITSASETTDVSAAPQTCALGAEEGLTVPEIVQYSLEATETAMDKAKTPEEMLEAMLASGERKEVRDLPM